MIRAIPAVVVRISITGWSNHPSRTNQTLVHTPCLGSAQWDLRDILRCEGSILSF
jgi:hypothetical protein